jgi:4-carboxymuconolactone decarboxylase
MLLKHRRIPDALYARAVAEFEERGVVELVAVLGYYGLVALTANAFELGIPHNVAVDLQDPDFVRVADS